ncbi:MAG TPA: hypothetical protein VJH92_03280 [Candidatus Nanoarchaeia archaeon]|nr:hypothetical protein [Candidatus Nanoarchaeia archaeon]
MKYISLRLNDNWGNKSYYTKGKTSREVEFKDGQELNVQWPDDTITEEKVKMSYYSEHINDMGHEYAVSGKLPTFRIKVSGLEVIVDNFEGLKFRDDELKLKEIK